MREPLLDILAEPVTGAPLELSTSRRDGDEIVEGALTSRVTGRSYPIENGIPRFVPRGNYAGSFGMQWNRFRTVQLDSVNGTTMSKDRFDQETGWTKRDLEGKLVLDMGCGAGRFAEVAAATGARFVGLDLSSAVDATRDTLRERFPTAEVVQGDLLQPPFKPGSFDYVYCLGVLQHTPDPAAGCKSVVRMTKAGGQFAMTIYGRRPWTLLNGKYVARTVTRRLPGELLLSAIRGAMPVAFPVTNRLFKLPVVGKVLQFALPIDNYVDHPVLRDDPELRYEFAVLDTFDGLAPAHDHPMTASEVEDAIRGVPAASWTFRERVPVVVTGVR